VHEHVQVKMRDSFGKTKIGSSRDQVDEMGVSGRARARKNA
jgi:hypothetical protein